MELQTKMNTDTKKVYEAGLSDPVYVSFETWEKLPSNFKLTKGECNQLYNIISWLTPGDKPSADCLQMKSVSSFLNEIAAKLEKEI